MSGNNIEEKEILEEQIVNEEESEAAIENITAVEQTEEEHANVNEPKVSFIKSLSAAIVDKIMVGIISILMFYIFDALLKIGGYYIAQKISMLFLIFVVVSILYTSIMEASKSGHTIGKKLLNL